MECIEPCVLEGTHHSPSLRLSQGLLRLNKSIKAWSSSSCVLALMVVKTNSKVR